MANRSTIQLVEGLDYCMTKRNTIEIHPGDRFERLTVLRLVETRVYSRSSHLIYECQCDCGNKTKVGAGHLVSRHTRSCGCLNRELSAIRIKKFGADRIRRINETPKQPRPAAYNVWLSMKQRCYNPNVFGYERYGGRGITICERWLNSFENFLADMGERPSSEYSIDRIDGDKGYEPSNCRWATKKEQGNNRCTNLRIEWRGEVKTVAQWAEELYPSIGVSRKTLYERLRKGWPVEKAFTEPLSLFHSHKR